MILSDEQCDRFFDAMDALLTYVNNRFQVVRNLSFEERSMMADAQISLVAHELWDNVSIIDDFVAENPYGFSQQYLNTVQAWKCALPGYFKVVRYLNDQAVFINEAGVFCVNGVTTEIKDEIGPVPAYVEATLLPFDDRIIYDGFLMAFDVPEGSLEGKQMQDEFEERCREGIAKTAGDFCERVRAWNARKESEELDKLLEDIARESAESHAGETLPEGFHRGALAGLSAEERKAALDGHLAELDQSPEAVKSLRTWFDSKMTLRAAPSTDLETCLNACKKAMLQELAVELTVGLPASARKAEFAREIAQVVPQNFDLMESTLVEVPESAFSALERALREGDFSFTAADIKAPVEVSPVEPYSFVFRVQDDYTLVVPVEVRRMMQAADLDNLLRRRKQRKAAVACMEAAVVFYGAATVDQVYEQYCLAYSDPMDKADFELLAYREASFNDMGFCLWNYESVPYIVHFTLSRDYVAQHLLSQQRGRIMDFAQSGQVTQQGFNSIAQNARTALQAAFDDLEKLLETLVATHKEFAPRPFDFDPLTQDCMDTVFADQSVVALRAFFDEHVPDGQDDYLFADRVVEEIVTSAIEVGDIHDVYTFVHDSGIEFCCEDPDRLPMLVSGVFSAMPSWDSFGYSPIEIFEQMTGRKVFLNEKGQPMRVGRDEPCPCGSGLKYRDCHGR